MPNDQCFHSGNNHIQGFINYRYKYVKRFRLFCDRIELEVAPFELYFISFYLKKLRRNKWNMHDSSIELLYRRMASS